MKNDFTPSSKRKFTKGQVLRINGPKHFPFSMLFRVTGNTRSSPQRMAACITRLELVDVQTKVSNRIRLLHWNDTAALDLEGLDFTFENVEVLTPKAATGVINELA